MSDAPEIDAPFTRVAGFETGPDGVQFWRDPGNGQFARPGWSTAKGLALEAVTDFAREFLRHKPEGGTVQTRRSIDRLGIPKGAAVRARYHDDRFGVITDAAGKSHKVRWDVFANAPVPEKAVVAEHIGVADPTPIVTPNTEASAPANRLRQLPGQTGPVLVATADLNRHGIPFGATVNARYLDDTYAAVAGADGIQRKVRWSQFSDAVPDGGVRKEMVSDAGLALARHEAWADADMKLDGAARVGKILSGDPDFAKVVDRLADEYNEPSSSFSKILGTGDRRRPNQSESGTDEGTGMWVDQLASVTGDRELDGLALTPLAASYVAKLINTNGAELGDKITADTDAWADDRYVTIDDLAGWADMGPNELLGAALASRAQDAWMAWQGESVDPFSYALQRNAVEAFSLYGAGRSDALDGGDVESDSDADKLASVFLQAQKRSTQATLEAAGFKKANGWGVDGQITLYRGALQDFTDDGGGESVLLTNPLTSWSIDPDVAVEFASSNDGAYVYKADVNVADIVSLGIDGFGSAGEGEAIVAADSMAGVESVPIRDWDTSPVAAAWMAEWELHRGEVSGITDAQEAAVDVITKQSMPFDAMSLVPLDAPNGQVTKPAAESLFGTDFGFADTAAPTLFGGDAQQPVTAPTPAPEPAPMPVVPDPVAGPVKAGDVVPSRDVGALPVHSLFEVEWAPDSKNTYKIGPDGRVYNVDHYDEYGQDVAEFGDYVDRDVTVAEIGEPKHEATPERVKAVLDALYVDSPANEFTGWEESNPDNGDVSARERRVQRMGTSAPSDSGGPPKSVLFTTDANGWSKVYFSDNPDTEVLGEDATNPRTYPPIENPFVVVPIDSPEFYELMRAVEISIDAPSVNDVENNYLSGAAPNPLPFMDTVVRLSDMMGERSTRLADEAFGPEGTAQFAYDPATGDFTPAEPGADGAVTLTRSEIPWMYARPDKEGRTAIRIQNRAKNKAMGYEVDYTAVDDRLATNEERMAALAEQRKMVMAMMPGGASNPETWFPNSREGGRSAENRFADGTPSISDLDALDSLARITEFGDRVQMLTSSVEYQTPGYSPLPGSVSPFAMSHDDTLATAKRFGDALKKVEKRKLTGTQLARLRKMEWAFERAMYDGSQASGIEVNDEGVMSFKVTTPPILLNRSPIPDELNFIVDPARGIMSMAFIFNGIPKDAAEFEHDEPAFTTALHNAVRRTDRIEPPAGTPEEITTRLAAHRTVMEGLGIDMGTNESIDIVGSGTLGEAAATDPKAVTVKAGLAPYPRSWTDTMADHSVVVQLVPSTGGGSNSTDGRDVTLQVPNVVEAPWLADVAAHEMGHTFEQTVPGLGEAQYWHALSRIKPGEKPVSRKMGGEEVVILEDEWADPYSGRLYDSLGFNSMGHLEVFTTGIQGVVNTGHRAAARFDADPRLQSFITGILATVDPSKPAEVPRDQQTVSQLLGGSYDVDKVKALLRGGGLTDAQRSDLRDILAGLL